VIPGAAQIPFELFEPEPPALENFLIGDNAEVVQLLRDLGTRARYERAVTLWGAAGAGKTHLLAGLMDSAGRSGATAQRVDASQTVSDDPFVNCNLLIVDNADQLSDAWQGWLFTAFNHLAARGGSVITAGRMPPHRWPIRDDIRTRIASGLVFEIKLIPQDSLLPLLFDYALQRGVNISEEVLTYVLSQTNRDVNHLCQTIRGIDRLSLALKRPITTHLARAYLAQQSRSSVPK
jgi:DnaA-homolog protein